MDIIRYLLVNSKGSCKTYKWYPNIAADEICIALNLNLPDALFEKPQLVASITIPAEAAVPEQISSEVLVNTKEAIERATGLTFAINVVKREVEGEEPK